MRIRKPVTIAAAVSAAAALFGLGAIAVMNTPLVYAKPSSWLPIVVVLAMIAAPFISSQMIAMYRKD